MLEETEYGALTLNNLVKMWKVSTAWMPEVSTITRRTWLYHTSSISSLNIDIYAMLQNVGSTALGLRSVNVSTSLLWL